MQLASAWLLPRPDCIDRVTTGRSSWAFRGLTFSVGQRLQRTYVCSRPAPSEDLRLQSTSAFRGLTFAVGQRLRGGVHLGHLDAVAGGLGQPFALEVDGHRVDPRVGRPHTLDHPGTGREGEARWSAASVERSRTDMTIAGTHSQDQPS